MKKLVKLPNHIADNCQRLMTSCWGMANYLNPQLSSSAKLTNTTPSSFWLRPLQEEENDTLEFWSNRNATSGGGSNENDGAVQAEPSQKEERSSKVEMEEKNRFRWQVITCNPWVWKVFGSQNNVQRQCHEVCLFDFNKFHPFSQISLIF